MYRTFNMGVGMVWVVDEADAPKVLAQTDGYLIGRLESGERCVELL
jgi:phosphoribosylformylglycinamidine cyclo-ligase